MVRPFRAQKVYFNLLSQGVALGWDGSPRWGFGHFLLAKTRHCRIFSFQGTSAPNLSIRAGINPAPTTGSSVGAGFIPVRLIEVPFLKNAAQRSRELPRNLIQQLAANGSNQLIFVFLLAPGFWFLDSLFRLQVTFCNNAA